MLRLIGWMFARPAPARGPVAGRDYLGVVLRVIGGRAIPLILAMSALLLAFHWLAYVALPGAGAYPQPTFTGA